MIEETATQNRRRYSNKELYLGNLTIAIWILLGAASCALFYPLAVFLFLALSSYLVFYELGKHGCATCYYCKTCTIGIGKLPGLFFKKAGNANVNRRALRLFPFVYLLLSVLPMVLVIVSLFQEATVYKAVLLAAILAYSLFAGLARRQTLFANKS